MPDPIPAEAVQAAAEALRTKQWGSRSTSAHGAHKFHGYCEICQRNVQAIAEVAVEAAAPFLAGAGSPAACPSVASESTESAQNPSAAPVYPPVSLEPAEALSASQVIDAMAPEERVLVLEYFAASDPEGFDHAVREAHARYVRAGGYRSGAGAVPGEHTGSGNG